MCFEPEDNSGESNSNLRAKSSHLKFPSQLQTAEQVESSFQAPLLRVPNRLNPAHASPHVTQTASAMAGDDVIWPPRRPMPPMPEGEITQQVGEEFCRRICGVYPEVFNGGKGHFLGADATMILKPGGFRKNKAIWL